MPGPASFTREEQNNIELAREYMRPSYTPGQASMDAVAHLCASGNRFIAPTTFPDVRTLGDYGRNHGKLMEAVNDLRLVEFDVLFANGDRVAIRSTAEESHKKRPHGRIQPSGRKARCTAAALFRADSGKLTELMEERNKLAMWEQLGWPVEECQSGASPAGT